MNIKTTSILFVRILVITLFIGVPFLAYSHHGSNSNPVLYLAENLLQLEGEVTSVFWRNPHPRIILSVVDENGQSKEWELEMGGNINAYTAQGLDKNFLQAGDRIRAAGVVSRRDSSSIGLLHLLMPNGEEMVNGRRELLWSDERMALSRKPLDAEAVRAAEATANGLFRVWGRRIGGRPAQDTYAHLFNEAARARADAYYAPTDNPELGCESGIPTNMFDPTPMEIIDAGDHILIKTEEYDLVRTVYMTDDRPEPQLSNVGYSYGEWDGDTLVVYTSHIDWPNFDPYGTPQSQQMTFVERFSVADDDSRLNYEIVATDPAFLNGPIELARAWAWQPGTKLVPFDCAAEVTATN